MSRPAVGLPRAGQPPGQIGEEALRFRGRKIAALPAEIVNQRGLAQRSGGRRVGPASLRGDRARPRSQPVLGPLGWPASPPNQVPADTGSMLTWHFCVNRVRPNSEAFAFLQQHAFGGMGVWLHEAGRGAPEPRLRIVLEPATHLKATAPIPPNNADRPIASPTPKECSVILPSVQSSAVLSR